MLPRDAEGMLIVARSMMDSISTVRGAVALLEVYLQQPEEQRTTDGTEEARNLLSCVSSGEWARERRVKIQRQTLCRKGKSVRNEASVFIAEIGRSILEETKEAKRERRRERRLWREALARNVYQWTKEGKNTRQILLLAGGISYFTLQRAYNRLKRVAGNPDMSNADLRIIIRSEQRRNVHPG